MGRWTRARLFARPGGDGESDMGSARLLARGSTQRCAVTFKKEKAQQEEQEEKEKGVATQKSNLLTFLDGSSLPGIVTDVGRNPIQMAYGTGTYLSVLCAVLFANGPHKFGLCGPISHQALQLFAFMLTYSKAPAVYSLGQIMAYILTAQLFSF